jgi:hypothetical protein
MRFPRTFYSKGSGCQGLYAFGRIMAASLNELLAARSSWSQVITLGSRLFEGQKDTFDDSFLLQQGSRVRMRGLKRATSMNGRTGTICADFNADTWRWDVIIDATASDPATQGFFRPENLEVLRQAAVPYKSGVMTCRWKGAQGQSIVAGVAVDFNGVECLVVHTDQVRRCHHDTMVILLLLLLLLRRRRQCR